MDERLRCDGGSGKSHDFLPSARTFLSRLSEHVVTVEV